MTAWIKVADVDSNRTCVKAAIDDQAFFASDEELQAFTVSVSRAFSFARHTFPSGSQRPTRSVHGRRCRKRASLDSKLAAYRMAEFATQALQTGAPQGVQSSLGLPLGSTHHATPTGDCAANVTNDSHTHGASGEDERRARRRGLSGTRSLYTTYYILQRCTIHSLSTH